MRICPKLSFDMGGPLSWGVKCLGGICIGGICHQSLLVHERYSVHGSKSCLGGCSEISPEPALTSVNARSATKD